MLLGIGFSLCHLVSEYRHFSLHFFRYSCVISIHSGVPFLTWFRAVGFPTSSSATSTPKKIQDPTPVRFPDCAPKAEEKISPSSHSTPLVTLLQGVHRPTDVQLSHFEALGLHVIQNATTQDILPDASYLPPFREWKTIGPDQLEEATKQSKQLLSNGNLSPGVQTYQERIKELSIDNTAAFRTIRRIPAPPGEQNVRLGNAYEFFKNLEIFSGYWKDTSLPDPPPDELNSPSPEKEGSVEPKPTPLPPHLLTHQLTGTGSQLPPDNRQHLITAFTKLVAYDFGCNVSFARCEPRLYLTPSSTQSPSKPRSYFNSSATFVYRTPSDRGSARASIVEGPVAAISCRASTVFATEPEERLDLAREVVAVLLTAQQRAREGKAERRAGEGEWWTTSSRWGGGPGGPIGKEGDKIEESMPNPGLGLAGGEKPTSGPSPDTLNEVKRAIGGINGPSPSKRTKKGPALKDGNMQIYENYRKMLPPSSTWDRKARYCAIGKVARAGYDEIFLISALNHHVSIVRARVPESLLEILDGGDEGKGWERLAMWRSKWFDLFLISERVEAMELIWGMMAWLMRSQPPVTDQETDTDKMELN